MSSGPHTSDFPGIANRRGGSEAASSLLELLLVMSLMIALLAAVGFGFAGAGNGSALHTAQSLIEHESRRVFVLATSHETRARLLIAADATHAESIFREINVAYEWPVNSGRWRTEVAPSFFPSAVAIVPPIVSPERVVEGLAWPSGDSAPLSHLLGPSSLTIDGGIAQDYFYFEVAPGGGLTPSNTQVVVATVRNSAANVFRFDNVSAVRGVRVHANGRLNLLDDARNF